MRCRYEASILADERPAEVHVVELHERHRRGAEVLRAVHDLHARPAQTRRDRPTGREILAEHARKDNPPRHLEHVLARGVPERPGVHLLRRSVVHAPVYPLLAFRRDARATHVEPTAGSQQPAGPRAKPLYA